MTTLRSFRTPSLPGPTFWNVSGHSLADRMPIRWADRNMRMKELRCNLEDGVWRIAFAFDPKRKAVLLVAGDKSGVSERRFYRQLIARADERFDLHLGKMKG